MRKLTKKLTREERELADAKAKIERKYARIAKRRLNAINQKLFPDYDLLGMNKGDFEMLLNDFEAVKKNEPKQQPDEHFKQLNQVPDDGRTF